MTRLFTHFDHAIVTTGFVTASLQGLLVRASYVGITGIVLELCGRAALIAIRFAFAHQHPRQQR
jgi:hypothetical protein